MKSFEASIRKMLWPETRKKDRDVLRALGLPESRAISDEGYVYRTTAASCLKVSRKYFPDWLEFVTRPAWMRSVASWLTGASFDGWGVQAGPMPKGTPVNLISNLQIRLDPDSPQGALGHAWDLLGLALEVRGVWRKIGGRCSEIVDKKEELQRVRELYEASGLTERLVALSKCPDYVVNRGHYFGADLADGDKEALIAYLKYF